MEASRWRSTELEPSKAPAGSSVTQRGHAAQKDQPSRGAVVFEVTAELGDVRERWSVSLSRGKKVFLSRRIGVNGCACDRTPWIREIESLPCLDEGETSVEAAVRLGVSDSWIRKLRKRRAETGGVEPRPHAGGLARSMMPPGNA